MSFRHFWLLDLRVKIFKKNKRFLSLSAALQQRYTLYYARARLYVHIFCDG